MDRATAKSCCIPTHILFTCSTYCICPDQVCTVECNIYTNETPYFIILHLELQSFADSRGMCVRKARNHPGLCSAKSDQIRISWDFCSLQMKSYVLEHANNFSGVLCIWNTVTEQTHNKQEGRIRENALAPSGG